MRAGAGKLDKGDVGLHDVVPARRKVPRSIRSATNVAELEQWVCVWAQPFVQVAMQCEELKKGAQRTATFAAQRSK